ncbi:MAG: tRNA preQ1(34) S-adenosylmethionine ribosyltransferase-isomerase QueA [Candidatus Izemoplasmatales bacterium]|nr:tRNA preQ1(34) S-adenosylmethionine ribosyltransferase-isomerase QueA [Candidatus Izemoplasmatales bacterium]
MKTADFDYVLPEELIAQTPLENRSASRLLVCHRDNFEKTHTTFDHLGDFLTPGDVLVFNDTKVLPARLHGIKGSTHAHIELLLLQDLGDNRWEAIVRPARRVGLGDRVSFGEDQLIAVCDGLGEEGIRTFRLEYQGVLLEVLDRLGEMPLPPYIHEKLKDQNRYQTVYSAVPGSAAAPTAGLHFTKPLLAELQAQGIETIFLTLHVGLGTFRPVNVEDVETHQMHSEYYSVSPEAAKKLNKAKEEGRRIIAVGTTSTRTLETLMKKHGHFIGESGFTNIFIYPGYQFEAIDALITNFHLPKSTLMMLVSALASKEIIMSAYAEAVQMKYRFFSFGDSMFITNKKG